MPSNKVRRKIISPWTEEDMEQGIMLASSTTASIRYIADEVIIVSLVELQV